MVLKRTGLIILCLVLGIVNTILAGEVGISANSKSESIKKLLSENNQVNKPDTASFNCNSIINGSNQNLPYQFEEAVEVLQTKFKDVDQENTSIESKNLAKSLILADFVYAAFSFRLLGSELETDEMQLDWYHASLQECYTKGNNNELAVYCGERSIFFSRMLDSLLHLKSRIMVIPGVHNFPLVQIGELEYIVDPYDPFVVFNPFQGELIPYNQLADNQSNLSFFRTKRIFGATRDLISDNMVMKATGSNDIREMGKMFKNYITENILSSPQADSICNYANLPNFSEIKVLNSGSKYHYAIKLNTREDGNVIDANVLKRCYLQASH